MITVSAGEYATTVTKACLGAGVERGIAIELGHACMELVLLGQRPIPVLIQQFGIHPARVESDRWENGEEGWKTPEIASLPDAVSMIDFVAISDFGSRSNDVHAPVLVLGLALNRMRCHGLVLEISLNDEAWTNAVEATVRPLGELDGCSLALRECSGNSEPGLPDIVALDVLEDDWNSLKPWVARTLVKADETNRADAGAGNTDND